MNELFVNHLKKSGVAENHIIKLALDSEKNIDVYVTGSNSKFLSSDIITEFRGRGDQIRVFPLSFAEFVSAFDGDKYEAWNEYITYGGLPLILSKKTDEEKSQYLKEEFEKTIQEERPFMNINDNFKKL